MNESTTTIPSLLSLSAPVGRERRESAPADGFAEELDAAASQDANPRDQPSTNETRDVESGESPQPSEQERAANTADDSKAEPPSDEGSRDEKEAALLSVTAATETLVVPTSPDAVLPAEAATTLDVAATADGPYPESKGQSEEVGEFPQHADTTILTAEVSPSDETGALLAPYPEPKAQVSGEIASKAALDNAAQSAALLVGEQVAQGTDNVTDYEQGIGDGSATSTEASVARLATSMDDSIREPSLVTEADSARASEPAGDRAGDGDGDGNNVSTEPALATVSDEALPVADTTPTSDTTNDPNVRGPSITPTDSIPEANIDRIRPGQVESIESRPTVDTARFVSRVAGAVNSANERGGPIEIRLSPPELGALRVSIEVKEGVLTAQLEAETPAARATLLDNLPALRDRLEQQQIRIDKFDVDVRDESSQRDSDWQPPERDGQRPDERSDRREPRHSHPESHRTPTQTESTTPRTITFDSNGINLVA